MAWLIVDKGEELLFEFEPKLDEENNCFIAITDESILVPNRDDDYSAGTHWRKRIEYGISLPKGTIKKLIGLELTCEDGPFKYE